MAPTGPTIVQWLRGLIILFLVDTVTAACYLPNGVDRNKDLPRDTYRPVNPGDDVSMCCSRLGDKPRPDGLCENKDGTIIWRESCTDRTWQSPKCIKLCAGFDPDTNNTPGLGLQMDNDEQVTPCSDGSYCCGDGPGGASCCNDGRGVFLNNGTTQAARPASTPASSATLQSLPASTTTTGASVGSTANAASPPSPAPSSSGSGISGGAIAGIVIGALAGIASLVVALWFLLFRRRKADGIARNDMTPREGYPPGSPFEKPINAEPQEAQGSYAEDYKRSELQAGAYLESLAPATQHHTVSRKILDDLIITLWKWIWLCPSCSDGPCSTDDITLQPPLVK
ncbi:MAG: hypothetical protein Q9169_007826 [Polycauliona sp. 2 TL-2023]